ncbi:ISL3 family transposase [Streptomyces sp. NPDC056835]|uniref:ISL3 family transposase n=1 Tax=Streptomyces sp. NPDC056835 TaxID=3345956 RepID=UPI0036B631EE
MESVSSSLEKVLFPGLPGVFLSSVDMDDGVLRVEARATAEGANCPVCDGWSSRVHSSYLRFPVDMPTAGQGVVVSLCVRRFLCGADSCPRRTFVEQIPGLTRRHGRWTERLRTALGAVGLALAGRAGARLAERIGVNVSRMTLLRLVAGMPDPAHPAPRVLGVDDFALRKGHVYGTVLIDCGERRVVDVLPDRESGTLAAWLTAHPGAEIVCRDRAGAYAEGIRTGAPGAVQIADRFHLWQNLAQAVERLAVRHRGCIPRPSPAPAHPIDQGTPDDAPTVPTGRFAERARQHHALVHGLIAEGHSLRSIAHQLGWGRHTVQRYARAATWEDMIKGSRKQRSSALDPFKQHLSRRAAEGCTNARVLHREVAALGFRGSYSSVCDFVLTLRTNPVPIAPAPPSVRRVTGWITRHPDALSDDEQQQLKQVLAACPELETATGHVRTFARMLTRLEGERLPEWIAAASAADLPGVSSFARGLERDLDAVTAGLTQQWNSGLVEGNVNRIKMLKRQTYGRAGFPLLRKRILLT